MIEHQGKLKKAATVSAETANEHWVVRYLENLEKNDPNWLEKCRAPYLEYIAKRKSKKDLLFYSSRR